jgi:hypothetical protein
MAAQQPTGVVRQQFCPADWRSLRRARGLPLSAVSDGTRINKATLSLAERGLRRLSPGAEMRLARFFFGDVVEK